MLTPRNKYFTAKPITSSNAEYIGNADQNLHAFLTRTGVTDSGIILCDKSNDHQKHIYKVLDVGAKCETVQPGDIVHIFGDPIPLPTVGDVVLWNEYHVFCAIRP